MKNKLEIKKIALDTIIHEANALNALTKQIGDDFVSSIELILRLKGRVIVTGIGKSALIGKKIVATFNSTGTPAVFMHAADAIHGDLGVVQPEDLVVVISKSGNTPEIKVLVSLLRQRDNPLIGIVGNRDSYLWNQVDYVLDSTIGREACPLNLAPTTSSVVQLAIGNALAVCLIKGREFSEYDFAKLHPGGSKN